MALFSDLYDLSSSKAPVWRTWYVIVRDSWLAGIACLFLSIIMARHILCRPLQLYCISVIALVASVLPAMPPSGSNRLLTLENAQAFAATHPSWRTDVIDGEVKLVCRICEQDPTLRVGTGIVGSTHAADNHDKKKHVNAISFVDESIEQGSAPQHPSPLPPAGNSEPIEAGPHVPSAQPFSPARADGLVHSPVLPSASGLPPLPRAAPPPTPGTCHPHQGCNGSPCLDHRGAAGMDLDQPDLPAPSPGLLLPEQAVHVGPPPLSIDAAYSSSDDDQRAMEAVREPSDSEPDVTDAMRDMQLQEMLAYVRTRVTGPREGSGALLKSLRTEELAAGHRRSVLQAAYTMVELKQGGASNTVLDKVALNNFLLLSEFKPESAVKNIRLPKSMHMVKAVLGTEEASKFEFAWCEKCGYRYPHDPQRASKTRQALLEETCPQCGSLKNKVCSQVCGCSL